jgi:lysophospholipase L1-like esterase
MRRIMVDGDSTAYGYNDDVVGGWANRLGIATMDMSTNPIIVKNDAEPGRTLPAIVKTHTEKAQAAQRAGDVTSVIQVGLNESKIMLGWTKPIISLKRFGAQALQFCEVQRESGIRTMLIGPQPIDDRRTNRTAEDVLIVDELTASYGEAMRDAAKATETAYIDTRQVFAKFALEQVLDTDGYHPSPYGHELIHQAVQHTLHDMGAL